MADQVASKMSKGSQGSTAEKMPAPKKGEKYRCDECGMEIQVTRECGCKSGDSAHFHCCNQEMSKA